MKITRIEVFHIQRQLQASMRISRGGFQVREHALLRITCEDGTTGLGEGVGHARRIAAILREGMAQKALGKDVDRIEELKRLLIDGEVYFERCGSAICAASAIEMACWDALGKMHGVPASSLLGSRVQDQFETYASDIYWEEDPQRLERRACELVERGFRCVKAHLGCLPPREETTRVEALRRAVGNDVGLMIDLNAGYSRQQASEALAEWEQFRLLWLEEPLHPNDRVGLAILRERSQTLLAAGENWFTSEDFSEPVALGALDYYMPDAARVGGLSEMKRIACMVESAGGIISPHNFSSGILLAATIQIMSTIPNAKWLEMDGSDNTVYQELLEEPLWPKDGLVRVPEYPGYGVRLPESIISRDSTERSFTVTL